MSNEDDNEEKPVTIECEEMDNWTLVIEILADEILWDADYEMMEDFDDIDPDKSSHLKNLLRISDPYCFSIPDDPSRSEALDLLKAITKLCKRVIKYEEKHLKK
jgi:hypothetical protein